MNSKFTKAAKQKLLAEAKLSLYSRKILPFGFLLLLSVSFCAFAVGLVGGPPPPSKLGTSASRRIFTLLESVANLIVV